MSEQQWVAIIDDDESIRTSLARVLRLSGIQAKGFGSAEEFLSRTGPEPACLVLDIHLGAGLNGIELQDRLAADGRTIPVIFMTGHAELLLAARGGPAGPPDFLRKPFETEALISRVQRHIRGDRGARSTATTRRDGP